MRITKNTLKRCSIKCICTPKLRKKVDCVDVVRLNSAIKFKKHKHTFIICKIQ